jgi:nucleoside-triphosphatase THEP1
MQPTDIAVFLSDKESDSLRMSAHSRVILWFAARHSGKTTAAFELARRVGAQGYAVAGLVAPSVYLNGELIGFDALDLRSNKRACLAVCKTKNNEAARFTFSAAGRRLARSALDPTRVESADLVIVDEFGPLEMLGKGWRGAVDLLLTSTDALILLVVRKGLTDRVRELYSSFPSQKLPATDPKSIDRVIAIIENRRRRFKERSEIVTTV